MKKDNTNKNSLYPDQNFDQHDDYDWQVSYLDVFTILLGFLFILLSFSDLDTLSATSISELYKSSTEESRYITTPIEKILDELKIVLDQEIETGNLEIERDLNDIRIRFSSDDLYRSGSATLQPGAGKLTTDVLKAIKKLPYNDLHIDVEGHTDNTPITTQSYPSNWELATARASNIVKHIAHMGINAKRLKASGYGDSRPRVPNQDSLGNPISKNKDLNRRIVIRLYYAKADTQRGGKKKTKSKSVRAY